MSRRYWNPLHLVIYRYIFLCLEKIFCKRFFWQKKKFLSKRNSFWQRVPKRKAEINLSESLWCSGTFLLCLHRPYFDWERGVLFYFQGILISFCSTESRYDWKCLNRQCESRGVEPQGRSLGLESKVRLGSECDSCDTLQRQRRDFNIKHLMTGND